MGTGGAASCTRGTLMALGGRILHPGGNPSSTGGHILRPEAPTRPPGRGVHGHNLHLGVLRWGGGVLQPGDPPPAQGGSCTGVSPPTPWGATGPHPAPRDTPTHVLQGPMVHPHTNAPQGGGLHPRDPHTLIPLRAGPHPAPTGPLLLYQTLCAAEDSPVPGRHPLQGATRQGQILHPGDTHPAQDPKGQGQILHLGIDGRT